MSLVLISSKYSNEMQNALIRNGHVIVPVGPCEAVSEPVSCHPDIYFCKLGTSPKSPIFQGDAALLGSDYPADVLYNAVVTEKYMICNPKTVSKDLISAAKELYPDIIMINVAQGYTKCNVAVVDERSFITEDDGIYKALCGFSDIRCLKISPGYVKLPGFSRGFIGGASGRIGDEIWFNGDISVHPDYESIKGFIEDSGLKIRYIPGMDLIDIGSIIESDVIKI